MGAKGEQRTPPPAPPPPEPLPVTVADNHCHLDIVRADLAPGDAEVPPTERIAAQLAAAAAVGVDRVVQIGCEVESAELTVAQLEHHPGMLGGVAIHPNEAARLGAVGGLAEAWARIEELACHPRVRVVGETGLDHFRTGEDGRAAQEESFRWHIDLAKRTGLPLQIHDRDAHAEVLRVLAEEGAPQTTVFHCFSGDLAMARECLERGYLLSFSGTVTFRSSQGLRDALAVTPLDQLLVETDAPFLTPTPHRGAVNSPAQLPRTVRAMAEVLTVDVPTLCARISATSERVYGPWTPESA